MDEATGRVLGFARERAAAYLAGVRERAVSPNDAAVAGLNAFVEPLPQGPSDAVDVLRLLDGAGSPGTVATAGARYFGFVTGGVLPAALGAAWLATAWDQNAVLRVGSPVAARLEEIAAGWVLELLGLPAGSGVGFVTGATMANFTAMCAARHALLRRAGWDVEAQGLFGAPEFRVVVGEEVHASLLKALALAGLGRERVERVPTDAQGRMSAAALPELDERTLVCIQAGNVNTGAFDPVEEVCERARGRGAWVHVDGAFGLWARACAERAHLARGVELADSWATDCHKWLNVPYDSGLVICRDAGAVRAGMASPAPYLLEGAEREPYHYVPEMSRRARGIEVWAALRSLGRTGVAELVERCCLLAARFAHGLRGAGFEVPHDVVLNQVLVRFGDDAATDRVIEAVQREGTCWCGGTTWKGRRAMRISISSWATAEADVDASLDAVTRCAREAGRR
ncbi:MAG TPA: aminotransferase class V-fold PLP-dependent enzyme [Phycisphaerales bacterium]|nr:aminotransferase class V-fold PLP-dependent enzyme [Phycisphaerales bacterium]